MTRIEKIRSMFDSSGFGLEIGPSHAPVFPKSMGYNVEVLDYAGASELRAKYAAMNCDTSRIEEVDYISDGREIPNAVPRRGEYDFIFSSHAIEHVPDIVGYFVSCELLLKPGGVVALAVPDKRFTFDAFRQVSTPSQALEAHFRGNTRHSPAAVYDFESSNVRLSGLDTWNRKTAGPVTSISNIERAKARLDQALSENSAYQDVHGWAFTPSSFRLILHDLRALGIIDLDEVTLQEEPELEFFVCLSRGVKGHSYTRFELQKKMFREIAASAVQMLAAESPEIMDAHRILMLG